MYVSFIDGKNFSNIIYNRSIDACKAFKGNSVTRLVFVILQTMQKYSNAPFRCPVPTGSYYIHDVDLSIINFPLGLPVGPVKKGLKCSIVLSSRLHNGEEIFIAEYNVYLKVVKKK